MALLRVAASSMTLSAEITITNSHGSNFCGNSTVFNSKQDVGAMQTRLLSSVTTLDERVMKEAEERPFCKEKKGCGGGFNRLLSSR